jgi:hypothetical protein
VLRLAHELLEQRHGRWADARTLLETYLNVQNNHYDSYKGGLWFLINSDIRFDWPGERQYVLEEFHLLLRHAVYKESIATYDLCKTEIEAITGSLRSHDFKLHVDFWKEDDANQSQEL